MCSHMQERTGGPSRPPAPHRTVHAISPHTALRRTSPRGIRPTYTGHSAPVGLGRSVKPPLPGTHEVGAHAGQIRIGVWRALSPCGQSRACLLLRRHVRSTGPSLSRRFARARCRRYYGLADSRRGRAPLPGSSPVIGTRRENFPAPRRVSPVPERVFPRVPSAFTPMGPPRPPVTCFRGDARLPRTPSGSPPTVPPKLASRGAELPTLTRFACATAREFAPVPWPVATENNSSCFQPPGTFCFPSLRPTGLPPESEGGLPDRTGNLSGLERFI